MARTIFTGPTPPAGPSGFEQSLALAGQGFGQGLGQGVDDVFTGRRRQSFLESMAPEGGRDDRSRQILDVLASNPSLLADENMFNQMTSMLTPPPEPPIVRAVEAAGLERGTPDFQQAVLRGSGALESTPEFIRMQGALDKAVAAGDTGRAEMIRRRISHMAGDLERARIAEARAARAQAGAQGGGRGDQRDRKIADLAGQLDAAGHPDPVSEAVAITDGVVSYSTNSVTGAVVRIDKRTGEAAELPINPATRAAAVGAETPIEDEGLYQHADEAAGALPAGREFYARTAGQVFGVDEDTQKMIEARQEFRLARGQLIRSFAENRRFPVAEVERIEQDVSLSPSAFDSPDRLRAALRALDKKLQERIEREQQAANDPNLARKDRSEAQRAVLDMEDFRRTLNVPAAGPADMPAPGFTEDEWGHLTPEERQEAWELSR